MGVQIHDVLGHRPEDVPRQVSRPTARDLAPDLVPRRGELRGVDARVATNAVLEDGRPRPSLPTKTCDVLHEGDEHLFGLAEYEQVDERSDGFGVGRDRPAGEDDGVLTRSIGAPQRDTRQVQHRQEVGEGELVLEREPHRVGPDGRHTFVESEQGQTAFPKRRFHVRPRRVDPVASNATGALHDVQQDGRALVAHSDLVGVGGRRARDDRRPAGASVARGGTPHRRTARDARPSRGSCRTGDSVLARASSNLGSRQGALTIGHGARPPQGSSATRDRVRVGQHPSR